MSAFVVDHALIDAILSYADLKRMDNQLSYALDRTASSCADWTAIGQELLRENLRSVLHRYPDCGEDDAPGTIGETVASYKFKQWPGVFTMPHAKLSAWILKSCNCFDYQACETDDYEQSKAHAIIDAIRHRVIRGLPHYEDAPWGITANSLKKSAA